ncbi:MAG: hypothetical protein V4594_14915 [Bacteroidota bacterium]
MGRNKKALSHRQERIAEKVAGRIVQAQRRLADHLNRRTVQVTGKTWLIWLIAFCAVSGSYLLYLFMQAFH